jgi:peptide/nickel transport system substrate-binding protein
MADHPRSFRVASLLALAVAALVLAACGSSSKSSSSSSGGSGGSSSATTTASSTSAGPQHAGGTVTVLESTGFAGDWGAGLDSATDTDGSANQSQLNAIYGELFQLGEGGKTIPDLATGYKFSQGAKVVEITIRHGVTFSDGTPLTGKTVAWSWNHDLAQPSCLCRSSFPGIKVTSPTPSTVKAVLAAPDGAFINQLQAANFNWIDDPVALKKMGEKAYRLKPVGAGPFTVASDTLSNQLVLKKNPKYWESGRPYLDGLTFKTTQDDETALEAMQSGQAQAYENMNTVRLLPSYKSKFTVTAQPGTSPYDIQFNTKIPPFNNKQARLAIYDATNASLLDQKLFDNAEPVGQSFTAPGGLFYTKTVPGYPAYDLAKAKAIVKQLGGLQVNLLSTFQPSTQNMLIGLQQLWGQAGIKVKLQNVPLATVIQEFEGGKWQAALQTAGAWDPAAGVGLAFRFTSNSPFSGVHDPKLDKIIFAAQGTPVAAKRKALYAQAAAYIAKNAYGPFLFPLTIYNIASHGTQGPGLTTPIPAVTVIPQILWQDVSTSSSGS